MASTEPVRVAIDVETTGLQVETESIIEIGAITFRGAEILDTFETMIDPGRPLPYRIQRLTHITPAMLTGAPRLGDVATRLRAFIGDMPLVGHSVGFDAGFLRKAHIAERNMLLDTFELASLLLPTLSSYSLENVAASLRLAAPVHHRALADAVLARDVLLALESRIAQLPDPLLNDLCGLASPAVLPMLALLRQEQRARGTAPVRMHGGSFGGALGAALNAKMRVDPAVLGTRLAALGPAHPVPANEMNGSEPAAGDADERVAETIGATFAAHETALVEISPAPESVESVLAPALAWVAQTGRRLVIAAGSMAGVRALMRRHIPRALATLAPEQRVGLTVAPLYEAQEYLCTHRWYGPGREGATTADGLRGLAKLTLWMHETETGTRDEVSLNPKEAIAWEAVRAGARFVHLADCAYRERGWCFLRRAQEAAAAARIVVTTHAVLLANQEGPVPDAGGAREQGNSATGVPAADGYLILDGQTLEDHAIAQATSSLDFSQIDEGLGLLWQQTTGSRMVRSQSGSAGRDAIGLLARAATLPGAGAQNSAGSVTRAREALSAFFLSLAAFLQESQSTNQAANEGVAGSLRLDNTARALSGWGALAESWQTLERRLTAVAETVSQATRTAERARGAESLTMELAARGQWLRQIIRWGHEAIVQPRSDMIYWARGQQVYTRPGNRGRGNNHQSADDVPAIHCVPAQIGGHISMAFGRLQAAPGHPANFPAGIVTAGTALTVNGQFDFVGDRLGIAHAQRAVSVTSDRSEQTLLLIPSDAPEPNAPTYQRALNEAIVQVAGALGGRTVVLFASYSAMRMAYNTVKPALEQQDIMVLGQSLDGSQRQLWQNYRAQDRVVLLGAGGFWDGWDADEARVGCLFIARLPLAALNDPLLAARAQGYGDAMHQFVVPHAALRLRGALNRLAWEHHERNVVVLYDRRVLVKDYGATILNSLPALTQREEGVARLGESARAWLDGPSDIA